MLIQHFANMNFFSGRGGGGNMLEEIFNCTHPAGNLVICMSVVVHYKIGEGNKGDIIHSNYVEITEGCFVT